MKLKGVSATRLRVLRRAKSVMKRRLRGNRHVIGIGIGYREKEGKLRPTVCVRVHVRRKFELHQLPAKQRIPAKVGSAHVDVIEGELFPSQGTNRSARFDPLVGGIMVANRLTHPEVGTLGAIAVDSTTGTRVIISNWHVLYGRPNAVDGEDVVQPRPPVAGNLIGSTKVGILNPSVDCAVAVLASNRLTRSELLELAPRLNGVQEAALGMRVSKSGVNGVAFGVIDEVDWEQDILFPVGVIHMTKQLRIKVDPASKPFFGDRDSGSIWVTSVGHRGVGLHFAGSAAAGVGIANPLVTVVKALRDKGVSIVFI